MKYEVNNILDIATYHHDNKTGVKLLVSTSDNRYCKITVPEIDFSRVSLTITQDECTISDEPWNKTFRVMQSNKRNGKITIPIKEDYNTHQLFTVEEWDK